MPEQYDSKELNVLLSLRYLQEAMEALKVVSNSRINTILLEDVFYFSLIKKF